MFLTLTIYSNLFTFQVAYTFDAGPNACLYLLESIVEEFMSIINYIFPPNNNLVDYYRGLPVKRTNIDEVRIANVTNVPVIDFNPPDHHLNKCD